MISNWGPDINYTPEIWTPLFTALMVLAIAAVLGVFGHFLLRKALAPKQEVGEETKTYLYSLPVRLWHWTNAILFILLISTGLYNHFTPASSYVKLHNSAGKVLIAAWLVFIVINIITGNIKHYKVKFSGFSARCLKQAMFYMTGILKGEQHPYHATEECKFNPLQQITYAALVYVLLPLILISGFLALNPDILGSGFIRQHIAKVHLAMGVFGLIFMVVHVYMCTCGAYVTQFIKGMIDGNHRH